MGIWLTEVKLRHLMTDREDWESIQDSMNKIADVLVKSNAFIGFDVKDFRNIPKGDDFFGPVDYANKLINRMYDFADKKRIWVG